MNKFLYVLNSFLVLDLFTIGNPISSSFFPFSCHSFNLHPTVIVQGHTFLFCFCQNQHCQYSKEDFLNFKNVCLKLNYSIHAIRQNFIYLISIIINLSSSATVSTISGDNITVSVSSSHLSVV